MPRKYIPKTPPALYPQRSGRPRETVADHGTIARYKHRLYPCRCGRCKEAWRIYKLAYRAKRRLQFKLEVRRLDAEGRYAEAGLVEAEIRRKS